MSTTFSVFPSFDKPPTVGAFLASCEQTFHNRCQEVGVLERPKLTLDRIQKNGNERIPFSPSDLMEWSPQVYAWLEIEGVQGGTDIYYRENDSFTVDWWRGAISDRPNNIKAHILEDCLDPGFHWKFRRSAGQSGAVNILYGLAAGCLGEISSGAVFSDDGAWVHSRLPMLGTQLVDEYMRPWAINDVKFSGWANRCITALKTELSSPSI